jgi:membrane protease YdiL (CAAX protease family)
MIENMVKKPRSLAIVGAALALGLPVLFVFSFKAPDSSDWLIPRQIVWWSIAALVVFWALRVEKLSWSSLDIRKTNAKSILWAFAIALVTIFTIGLSYSVLIPALGGDSDPARMQELASRPIPMLLLLSLTAGVVEEWLFRFYAINRLHFLSNSKWLASLVAGVVFIILHAPSWGFTHLIPVSLVAVIFTLYYWWRRDFWSSALAHILTDAIPFTITALATQYAA